MPVRMAADRSLRLAVLAACLAYPAGVEAQSTVPDDIKAKLIEVGFNSPYVAMDELYLPLLAAGPKDDVTITKDLAYGDHARHRLDVYEPDGISNAPVFVYIHGGGYRTGERDINEEIYGNVLHYFTRQGMLGINATYRLAPEAQWPSGGEDMRAVIEWVRANAAEYGGDPDRIYMMGHSAGATHVATYAFDKRFQPTDGHGLSGIVLVSGRYVIKDEPGDPSFDGIRQYFGEDISGYPTRSIVNHVPGSDVAAMLVIAEYDQRNLVETTGELFVALCDRDDGSCPRMIQLKYHNHMSEISHVNTSDDQLGREVVEFILEGSARQSKRAALAQMGVGNQP